MNGFNMNDEVWFYEVDTGEAGTLYAQWIRLQKGRVVWLSDDEEIMHVYVDGNKNLREVLAIKNYVYHSKEDATNYFVAQLNKLMDSKQ